MECFGYTSQSTAIVALGRVKKKNESDGIVVVFFYKLKFTILLSFPLSLSFLPSSVEPEQNLKIFLLPFSIIFFPGLVVHFPYVSLLILKPHHFF